MTLKNGNVGIIQRLDHTVAQETLFFNDAILVEWMDHLPKSSRSKPPATLQSQPSRVTSTATTILSDEFGRHRCLVTGCATIRRVWKELLVVASNNDYLSMDVERGVDAISMNECLPIVSRSDACER
jgi:hypothetical protein